MSHPLNSWGSLSGSSHVLVTELGVGDLTGVGLGDSLGQFEGLVVRLQWRRVTFQTVKSESRPESDDFAPQSVEIVTHQVEPMADPKVIRLVSAESVTCQPEPMADLMGWTHGERREGHAP